MKNVLEHFVFSPRTKCIYEDVLKRLKPNRIREAGHTGFKDDGKTPFMDAFEKHVNEPYIICLAHGIADSWLMSEPVIFDDDIIVGFPRPERKVYEHFSWGIMGNFAEGECERFDKLKSRMIPMDNKTKDDEGVHRIGNKKAYNITNCNHLWWTGGYQGHTVPSYEKLLRLGLDGTLKQIEHYDAFVPSNEIKKKDFYRACRIIIKGMSDWIKMYANKAEEMAENESDSTKKSQLKTITKTCLKISTEAPETLLEACQLMWFFCLWDWVDCIGRFDQYMYPFYKGHEEDDIIVAAVMKFWEHGVHNITLSGVNSDGSDATNEITYLILNVLRTMHETHPRLSVRIHENTPSDLMKLIVLMWSEGMSDPSVASDKNIIDSLVDYGVPLEKARNYSLLGCQEIEIPGESNFGCEDGSINLAKILEYTLYNGMDRVENIKVSIDTGSLVDYKTFDDLWNAYVKQVKYLVPIFVDLCNIGVDIRVANVSKLVKSTMTEACIQRGLNLDDGGAVYKMCIRDRWDGAPPPRRAGCPVRRPAE